MNQDALGVQARRVLVQRPANTSLTPALPGGALVVAAACDATRATQAWSTLNPLPPPPPHSLLYTAPCNASDAYQQWSFASGAMANVGAGTCIDKSAPSDPAHLLPCASPPTPAQTWALQASGHIASGGACLDVYNFQGPDVEVGGCKAPGAQDSNQVFQPLPGGLLRAASTGLPPGTCLTASLGPFADAVPISTVDASGQVWCMSNAFGSEGGIIGVPCGAGDPHGGRNMPLFEIVNRSSSSSSSGGAVYSFRDARGGGGININNQVGASGPWPHTRYTSCNSYNTNGALFELAPGAPAPGRIQAADQGLLNDDLVGGVTVGGDFCLDIVTGGLLEVWVAPLTGGRFAAALFNRSPGADAITLPWAALNVSAGTPLRVYDIWQGADMGTALGSYTAAVNASAAAYLLLSPP